LPDRGELKQTHPQDRLANLPSDETAHPPKEQGRLAMSTAIVMVPGPTAPQNASRSR